MEEFLFVLGDLITRGEFNLDVAHKRSTSIHLDRDIVVHTL
jgi:hypothetical protein